MTQSTKPGYWEKTDLSDKLNRKQAGEHRLMLEVEIGNQKNIMQQENIIDSDPIDPFPVQDQPASNR